MKLKIFSLIVIIFVLLPNITFSQVANFTSSGNESCEALAVTFNDASTGSPTSWAWDFGNGNTSIINPTVSANYSSTVDTFFVVSLETTYTTSANSVHYDTIHIYAKPTANFVADITSGCEILDVTFTNTSITSVGLETTSWYFGGSIPSSNNINSTTVSFPAGIYSVTILVEDSFGCTDNYTQNNYISSFVAPTASFNSPNNQSCSVPSTVNFNNNSINGASAVFTWDFDDGSSISNLENPNPHSYTSAGSYTASLVVAENGCSDTAYLPVDLNPQDANFYSSDTTICLGQAITFYDNSVLIPNSYSWNFGEGPGSSSPNPTYAYNNTGVYTVTLDAFLTGCDDIETKTNFITVLAGDSVSFIADNTDTCGFPFTVNFTSYAPAGSTYNWDFDGNGTFDSSLPNPSFTYNMNGSFNVSLTVVGPSGCTSVIDSFSLININGPNSDFTIDTLFGCVPITVNSTDNSNSIFGIETWSWDFGDNIGTSTSQNPSYTYNGSGNYEITLTVTDSLGCIDSITKYNIEAGDAITPNFTASPDTSCRADSVTFLNLTDTTGVGNVIEWYWEYGDGGISTNFEEVYLYGDTGIFDVTLVTINNGCVDTLVIDSFVNIYPPIANFSMIYDCENDSLVEFIDNSIGPDNWWWVINNDSINSQNTNYAFPDSGIYNIALYVENNTYGCVDSIKQDITIVEPFVDFSYADTTGCVPFQVQFNETSQDAISYEWQFSNGLITYFSYDANPLITFNEPGIYDVTLIITSFNDCKDTLTKNQIITVFEPVADFTADVTVGCYPLLVNFTDLSISDGGSIVDWNWSFGSTIQNPSHTYTSLGTFDVTLTIVDSFGCTASKTINNYIQTNGTVPSFTNDPTTCKDGIVNFYNNSYSIGGTVTEYFWDFGDHSTLEDTSLVTNPSYSYPFSGNYDISLTVVDDNGCDSTIVAPNNVSIDSLYVNFSASDSVGDCVGFVVDFLADLTPNAISTYWDFGNFTNISNINNPNSLYLNVGTYDVSLIATTASGCIDTMLKPDFITVNGPTGILVNSQDSGCANVDIEFCVLSTNSILQAWDPGNGTGTTNSQSCDTFTYSAAGIYLPSVILEDSVGCTATYNFDTIRIGSLNPGISFTPGVKCAPDSVTFIDVSTATPPIFHWNWNFDNGSISVSQYDSTLYTSPGNYNVELIVENTFCIDTVNTIVTIDGVIGIANNSIDSGCINLDVEFSITSTNSVNQIWSFGDGISVNNSIQNTIHSYSSVGTFAPNVIISDSVGCLDTLYFDTIYTATLNAEIYSDTNNVCAPNLLQFVDSTNSSHPLNWNWDFDNNNDISILENPFYNFDTIGVYNVELIVDNGFCIDTAYKTITSNMPLGTINNSIDSGCINLDIDFTFNNENSINQTWNFGDGTEITNLLTSELHTYNTVGIYYPYLIIEELSGCVDTLYFDTIYTATLNAEIYTDTNNICAPNLLQFVDSTNSSHPLNWNWDFDNNNDISILENPFYNFDTIGVYNVELIVDNGFCIDTAYKTITANGVFGSINNSIDSGCIDLNVNFVFNNVNSINQDWNFGDGTEITNTSSSEFHIYDSVDVFYPSIIIEEVSGCIDTLYFDTIYTATTNANFIVDKNYVCSPDIATFTDLSTSNPPLTNWQWNFGDGNSSNSPNPTNNYILEGVFDVQLIVDNGICADTAIFNNLVSDSSTIANYNFVLPALLCPPVIIQTFSTSIADSSITTWNWDFGNGITDIVSSPFVQYDTSGNYLVTLDIITEKGCISHYEDTIRINTIPSFSADSLALCKNQEATISYLGDDSYIWNPSTNLSCADCPDPTITANNSINYIVEATSEFGCVFYDTMVFVVNELPDIIVSDDKKVINGTALELYAFSTVNSNFNWFPNDKLSCNNCSDNTFIANESTEFVISIADEFNCINHDTIKIEVFDLCDGSSIFMPNIFTPNNDGKNDVFKATVLQNLVPEINYFRIFDRWGKLIFESTNINEGWDGLSKNKNYMNNGVYVYVMDIICADGSNFLLEGNVTLLK